MTYLFAWNPKHFSWDSLDDDIAQLASTGSTSTKWSTGNVRGIAKGSRFFFIRLGSEPRGLIGSGVTTSEVREDAHWVSAKAAKGETALMVDIAFDTLVRAPFVRRAELDRPPFLGCKWDTQMSGIRIPDDVAEALEPLWRRRRDGIEQVPATAASTVERWREFWEDASTSAAWVERHRLRDEKRRVALREMRELAEQFLHGRVDVEELRAQFDRKTRNEWDLFGLKGTSGAMLLNQMVKHISQADELDVELRNAMSVPADDGAAGQRIRRLMQYLDERRRAAGASGSVLQVNRVPFFLSAWWHTQQPEAWPIIFRSARKALQADGVLGRDVKGADGYLEFARVFRELSAGLEISFWDLEHVCHARFEAAKDEDAEEAEPDEATERERIWLVAPGRAASLFDAFHREGIVAIGWDYLGDLSQYDDLEAFREAIQAHRGKDVYPVQDALACYQFVHEMEVGDVVFAKKGRREIVGYGRITSEYRHEPGRERYTHVRSVDWKMRGEWVPKDHTLVTKTLTEIGQYPGLMRDIWSALGLAAERPATAESSPTAAAYELDEAMQELFVPREDVEEILELLQTRKNLVLQGPPGVGKTFLAKRLAYLLLGERDGNRIEQVQFHQSYAYEDFVQGYRPGEKGVFQRVDGPFMRFCDRARQDDARLPYVLIIDEINRGNLSKIFGELLLLIESDKRSAAWATTLVYGSGTEDQFHVPENLYIVGTMNTADRSIALVDYALRRRFVFWDIAPGFEQTAFGAKLESLGVPDELCDRIVKRLTRLNERIHGDSSLGRGFLVGHSYFCHGGPGPRDEAWYRRVVRTEIGPLLREYWFDDEARAQEEVERLLESE